MSLMFRMTVWIVLALLGVIFVECFRLWKQLHVSITGCAVSPGSPVTQYSCGNNFNLLCCVESTFLECNKNSLEYRLSWDWRMWILVSLLVGLAIQLLLTYAYVYRLQRRLYGLLRYKLFVEVKMHRNMGLILLITSIVFNLFYYSYSQYNILAVGKPKVPYTCNNVDYLLEVESSYSGIVASLKSLVVILLGFSGPVWKILRISLNSYEDITLKELLRDGVPGMVNELENFKSIQLKDLDAITAEYYKEKFKKSRTRQFCWRFRQPTEKELNAIMVNVMLHPSLKAFKF